MRDRLRNLDREDEIRRCLRSPVVDRLCRRASVKGAVNLYRVEVLRISRQLRFVDPAMMDCIERQFEPVRDAELVKNVV